MLIYFTGFPDSLVGKESACNAGDAASFLDREDLLEQGNNSSVRGLPCGSAGKESPCNVGDLGLIPGLGRSPGEGKGYPLQYCDQENSLECLVHGVAKSQTPTFTSLHFMLILYFIKWFLSGGKNIWKPLKCRAWGLPWWLSGKVPTWECRRTCVWSLV